MPGERPVILTADGKEDLEHELELLRSVKMPAVTDRIQQLSLDGDVSDNSEYEDTKEELMLIEARIREINNLLRRAQDRFHPGRDAAIATLRRAEVVACDETGVRIEGSNAYHWLFHSAAAVVHTASPTRGAVVVREMMDGHRPAVWISDRYTAQQGHADEHQTCLAHLARDVAYVVEVSDDPVPWRLQLWLQSVFALAERVTDLAAATLSAKRRSLDRQLGAILATPSRCDLTREL